MSFTDVIVRTSKCNTISSYGIASSYVNRFSFKTKVNAVDTLGFMAATGIWDIPELQDHLLFV